MFFDSDSACIHWNAVLRRPQFAPRSDGARPGHICGPAGRYVTRSPDLDGCFAAAGAVKLESRSTSQIWMRYSA